MKIELKQKFTFFSDYAVVFQF